VFQLRVCQLFILSSFTSRSSNYSACIASVNLTEAFLSIDSSVLLSVLIVLMVIQRLLCLLYSALVWARWPFFTTEVAVSPRMRTWWTCISAVLNIWPHVVGAQLYRLSTVDAHTDVLKPIHWKIIRHYSRYCAVAFCYEHKCELSYIHPGHDVKLHPHRVNYIE